MEACKMARTGIAADSVFKDHDTGPGHPECPARLDYIYSHLEEEGILNDAVMIDLRDAKEEELLKIHTKHHIDSIAVTDGKNTYLDGDTPASPLSYRTALLASGGLLKMVDEVVNGNIQNGFALVRPPGHHAENNRAMGFCLFNNIAVAAAHALDAHGMKKVLIVDWDVHHGNGTQHSFYDDPRVLFFSCHRYPFYPGTGSVEEIGAGEGKGYTINVPLPPGCGDDVYESVFSKILMPVAREYKPELILVSAGFDSYYKDPLGGMEVTEEGFARMACQVLSLADELCGGKVVFTLEGGYDLGGLARSVGEVVKQCMGKNAPFKDELSEPENFNVLIKKINGYLGEHWENIGSSV
jgi:acetoin utilization deacetylase AcuC-like enzyme